MTDRPDIRAFSFGGGVQSVAVLCLGALDKVQYDHYIFANVGEDSEDPRTLEYFRHVALPFAQAHNLNLIEVWREWKRGERTGQRETVYMRAMGDNHSVPIPARRSNGAPGRRACTTDFKIKVVNSFLKKHGATAESPAVVGLGISIDEMHRVRTDSGFSNQTLEYPLIDLRMMRRDCERVIREAGLPIPPKSACWFCPYKSRSEWRHMKNNRLELFAKAIALESRINEKRGVLKKYQMYLHPDLVPLAQAVANEQKTLDQNPDENCESGYCMT